MAGLLGAPPSPEARAIAGAAIFSGVSGAAVLTAVVAFRIFASLEGDPLWSLVLLALAFTLAFIGGTIATALMLLLAGAALARLSRSFLETRLGLVVAMGSAILVSLILGLLIAGSDGVSGASIVIMAYAIPAAILYRREILTERIVP